MANMGKGKVCGSAELPVEAVLMILKYNTECN